MLVRNGDAKIKMLIDRIFTGKMGMPDFGLLYLIERRTL